MWNPFKKDPPKSAQELAKEWLDLPMDELAAKMEATAMKPDVSRTEATAMTIVAETMQQRLEPLTWNRAQRRKNKRKKGGK